jgi:hypothetical protein
MERGYEAVVLVPDDETWERLDDRPALDVARLGSREREIARAVDRALGKFELTAMHARNQHRQATIEGDAAGVVKAMAQAGATLRDLARVAAAQADLFEGMLGTLRDLNEG